jgi:hypothetical protein
MKKLLLQMLACGIFTGASAQTGINSDKWVLKTNNLKASTGRVVIANKSRGQWTIYFYKMANNEYVTSFNQTNNKGIFVLQPGEYRITINDAEIMNVPVKKGHDTELKVGLLNVEHNDVWNLLDEDSDRFVTSGNQPTLLLMPVGNYTMNVGDIKKVVTVTEATVVASQVLDYPQFALYPVTGDGGTLQMPPNSSAFAYPLEFVIHIRKAEPGNELIFQCGYTPYGACQASQPLPEGKYNIHHIPIRYGSLYDPVGTFIVRNVLIKKGYETRLKFGYVEHYQNGLFIMTGENGSMQYYMLGSYRVPVPIGQYTLKHLYVGEVTINVEQDKSTKYQPMIDEPASNRYTLKPANTSNLNSGRLLLREGMIVRVPSPSGDSFISASTTRKYLELPAGEYIVRYNEIFGTVEVKARHETSLKLGKIGIKSVNAESWEIRPLGEGTHGSHPGTQTKLIELPVGYYRLTMGMGKYYLIKITEGGLVEFYPG